MLQQTQVTTMLPYYKRFITALPDVPALASCEDDRLHKLWEGLGYYRRAHHLKKAAQMIMRDFHGEIPNNYEALLSLPGIGPYTAGAIASIAFNQPYAAVDGNVIRVASRLTCFKENTSKTSARRKLSKLVQGWVPKNHPGDFNQAMMELGALICSPTSPQCSKCPLGSICCAQKAGIAETLPVRSKAKPKAIKKYTIIALHVNNRVVLQKRPQTGLLANMWQPLMLKGHLTQDEVQSKCSKLGIRIRVLETLPDSEHVFSHQIWKMTGWTCSASGNLKLPNNCVLASRKEIQNTYALPSAFHAYFPWLLKDIKSPS